MGATGDEEGLQSRRFLENPSLYYEQEAQQLHVDYIFSFDAYVHKDGSGSGELTLEQRILSSQYRLLKEYHHADFRYDYDSSYEPRTALLYAKTA